MTIIFVDLIDIKKIKGKGGGGGGVNMVEYITCILFYRSILNVEFLHFFH